MKHTMENECTNCTHCKGECSIRDKEPKVVPSGKRLVAAHISSTNKGKDVVIGYIYR